MKQSGCTIFIQISLCLIVYVSLHLSHQSLSSSNDGDNAGALDLHFISFSGGFRPLHRQTRLLQLALQISLLQIVEVMIQSLNKKWRSSLWTLRRRSLSCKKQLLMSIAVI
ncbi:uncharacterized protein LOC108840006 [Raphanus sativus]|uniref:Uncharacterized protein LOC108840006 n=1 Tax=Raphanus sativus TaxID=3726 RepID=A0A9W3D7C7_RAPSA|nr:uncharacterized protein LOC108840006 [Raphanus sativus]